MLLVTLFALSCSAAAPFTREQTNEQQPLSENASASFTPLTPLNIFGSTAVFPLMFQLYIYIYIYIYTSIYIYWYILFHVYMYICIYCVIKSLKVYVWGEVERWRQKRGSLPEDWEEQHAASPLDGTSQ